MNVFRQNNKGLMVISDVVTLLIFIVVAVILFLFAFWVLRGSIEGRLSTEPVGNDAAFIASTLPRLSNPNYGDVTLAEYVQKLAHDKKQGVDITTTPAFSSYQLLLDNVFSNENLFKPFEDNKHNAIRQITSYNVVLRSQDTYWDETCFTYAWNGNTVSKESGTCNFNTKMQPVAFGRGGPGNGNQPKVLDQDTGMYVPSFQDQTQIGTAFIATTDGPIMIQVIIHS